MLDLIRWIVERGHLFVFGSICTVLVTLTLLAPFLRHKLQIKISKEMSDAAESAHSAIITFLVFILATSLITLEGKVNLLNDTVAKEAESLVFASRSLSRLSESAARQAEIDIRQYTYDIINKEWKLLGSDKYSEDVERDFVKMLEEIEDIEPQNQHEAEIQDLILHSLQLADQERQERLANTGLSLSPIYWAMILGLSVLLIFLAAMGEWNKQNIIKTGGVTFALALFISMVLTFECPFNGDVAVKPKQIEIALKKMSQH
ncbi:MAG: hypothetical protein FD163_1469 [Hyphomonadaceae bacterium]|nr:MAG: hypothetical protein FD128_1215 [Hyphomonadaceae bacterium]KAF0184772.1 MAG: hypothetical protein FD163_1469 [Hyphomonadaceae bacterium]